MTDYGWRILPSHLQGFLGIKMSLMEDGEAERINRSQVHLATATRSAEQRRSTDETQAQRRSTAKGHDQWQVPSKTQEQLGRPVRIKDLLEVPTGSEEQLGRPVRIQDLLEVPISSQVQLRRPKEKHEEQRERPPEAQEEDLAPVESQEHQALLGKCEACLSRSADHQEPQQRPTSLQEGTLKPAEGTWMPAECTLKLTDGQDQTPVAPHEPYICRGRGERTSAKEITMNPLQEWGEEVEDGVIYSVMLRRVKMEPDGSDSGGHMVDPDSPPMPGCGYVQYKTCKLRTLKAGSLEKLVENLIITDGSSDQTYVPCFLATYRAFTSTEAVLKVLLDRKLGCDEEDRSKWPGSPAPDTAGIRMAVSRVLSMWLEEYPDDFRQKPHYPCLKMIQEYLRKGTLGAEEAMGNQQVSSLLQQFEEEDTDEDSEKSANSLYRFSFAASENGEESDVPEEKTDLLSFPADEVAEQLTLMDAELFQRVVPFHCLGCIWSQRDKKEKKHLAPTVRATVAQFNAVTSSVMASVLADVQLRAQQRAKVLEKWISIAQKCRVLRNFSSLRAILSALQSNPIYRLKRAWAAVNRDSVTIFHKLSDIFSDENNHLTSREILMQEELPAGASCENSCRDDSKLAQKSSTQDRNMRPPQGTVPYLGTFLTDLIMLDTALPDFLENGMINFEKRRKEFEVLSTILKLQQTCQHYCLLPRPQIVSVFVRHRQLTDDQSYRVSRTIEPPADSCPNSPRIRRRLTKRFSSLLLGSEVFGPKQNGDRGGISPSGSSSSCDMDDGLLSPTLCVPDAAAAFPKSLLELPLNSPTSVCFQEDSLSPTASPTQAKQPLARVSSLPVYNQQIADLCIIRVSMENNHGNLYKSILLTSQDKTPTVILRALQKHNLDSCAPEDFQLIQLLDGNREFIIPDKANVYYAMSTSVNFDFILRRKSSSGPIPQSRSSPSAPSSPLSLARTANIPATVHLLGGHSLPRLL